MAALVQGYPQQSGTVTMLQARPASAGGMLPAAPAGTAGQYMQSIQQHRNSFHGLTGGVVTPVVYRGSSVPVQPYAFTSTPSLNQTAQWQQSRTQRTSSSPAVPTIQSLEHMQSSVGRSRNSASVSMTNLPSTASTGLQTASVGSRDDFSLPVPGTQRAAAALRAQPSQASGTTTTRAAPERYRRTALRSADSTASAGAQSQGGMVATSGNGRSVTEQNVGSLRVAHALPHRPNSFVGSLARSTVDDMGIPRGQSQDQLKRARRRSMPALDSAGFSHALTPPEVKQPAESIRPEPSALANNEKAAKVGNNNLAVDRTAGATHVRAGSSDSRSSGRSTRSNSRPSSSTNRSANVSDPTANPAQLSVSPEQSSSSSQDYPRLVNIPPRSSSSDAGSAKRAANPSPLSKPVTMDTEGEGSQPAGNDAAPSTPVKTPTTPRVESPAVRQLTAINEKGGRAKSKTSRLRRAFSFGSAADFRQAVPSGDGAENANATASGKLHKERDPAEAYDAEQARIAQQQEAAGIGSNIYSGGRLFSSSTDNLSISSTASSASIMIRKMGRGMKKGTRSLVGLFRPKSVIGVPAADAKAPEAAVSMVTVEAERERVNVNADPHAHSGGGTGFPRLERNSIDATREAAAAAAPERAGSSGTDGSAARKSIIAGDRERAEVLAAVRNRKGILKHTNTNSSSPTPSPRPSESKGQTPSDLPPVPAISDSPSSSAPSTPNEESMGHRRTGGTVTIGSEDYFVSALRLRQDTKSAPGTPRGSMKRNATFSPRIVFFETWPSQEYDRRGEIATCNRLTPMLAQQIKEELNNFKMEMEVHENSKIYTHFF